MRRDVWTVILGALLVLGLATAARPALAGVQIGVSIGLPVPAIVAPAPVVVAAPAPVFVVLPRHHIHRAIWHPPVWVPGHLNRWGVWVHGHWR
jgi:hypothetical protein